MAYRITKKASSSVIMSAYVSSHRMLPDDPFPRPLIALRLPLRSMTARR